MKKKPTPFSISKTLITNNLGFPLDLCPFSCFCITDTLALCTWILEALGIPCSHSSPSQSIMDLKDRSPYLVDIICHPSNYLGLPLDLCSYSCFCITDTLALCTWILEALGILCSHSSPLKSIMDLKDRSPYLVDIICHPSNNLGLPLDLCPFSCFCITDTLEF